MLNSFHPLPDDIADHWHRPLFQNELTGIARLAARVEADAMRIQRIPAPTFAEGQRADFVAQRFAALGLADVTRDEMDNVCGRIVGRERGPALMISAHLDTVFGRKVALTLHQESHRLVGPGIGDNSMGVAGLLGLADFLRHRPPRRDLWLVANVAEEGLGNLTGMRAMVSRLQPLLGGCIVLEGGTLGAIIHRAIGVERHRIMVQTDGGHSWSDFGQPSAIHILSKIVAQISDIHLPETPRTTFNVGMIEGGRSVNTIAPEASALLDLRSENGVALAALSQQVAEILASAPNSQQLVSSERIGDRPAGAIGKHHPLTQLGCQSLAFLGHDALLTAASTDANIPLSRGIPTICIGVAEGHNAHRTDEWIDRQTIADGLQHGLLVVRTTEALLLR